MIHKISVCTVSFSERNHSLQTQTNQALQSNAHGKVQNAAPKLRNSQTDQVWHEHICRFACMHTHMHSYTLPCTHPYNHAIFLISVTCAYLQIRMHAHLYAFIQTAIHPSIQPHTLLLISVTCAYPQIHMHAHMCVHTNCHSPIHPTMHTPLNQCYARVSADPHACTLICVHTNCHTHIHPTTHTPTNQCYVCISADMQACTLICVHTNCHTPIHPTMHTPLNQCYMCVSADLHACTFICVHTNRHTPIHPTMRTPPDYLWQMNGNISMWNWPASVQTFLRSAPLKSSDSFTTASQSAHTRTQNGESALLNSYS